MRSAGLSRGSLHNNTAAHDKDDSLKRCNVPQGIAIDRDHIGQCTRFHDSNAIWHSNSRSSTHRRCPHDFDWWKAEVTQKVELAPILAVRYDSRVCAECDQQAGADAFTKMRFQCQPSLNISDAISAGRMAEEPRRAKREC